MVVVGYVVVKIWWDEGRGYNPPPGIPYTKKVPTGSIGTFRNKKVFT